MYMIKNGNINNANVTSDKMNRDAHLYSILRNEKAYYAVDILY